MDTKPPRDALKELLVTGKLNSKDVEFAVSLLSAKVPSEKQAMWIGKLVQRATNPAPAAAPVSVSAAGIRAMFETASQSLKYPKIRVETNDGQVVAFSVAGPASKYAGQIMVTDGGKYPDNLFFGRIDGDAFFPSAKATPAVISAVSALSDDPAKAAGAYGRLFGRCCFCARSLDDPKSVAVGYGPVCADKYGLPWGELLAEAA